MSQQATTSTLHKLHYAVGHLHEPMLHVVERLVQHQVYATGEGLTPYPLNSIGHTCFGYRSPRPSYAQPAHQAPQIWGGVRLPTFCPGGDVCQLFAKIQPKAGKYHFLYQKYNNLHQKCINKNDVCQFLGSQNAGKRPFLETYIF